ncbi:MAG TPA: hypothetical protein VIH61_06085, partial [Waddliaceae bacterium]
TILNLFKNNCINKCAIVITHDCDLQNEKEDEVELIVATVIGNLNPAYARARNVRCLHVLYLDPNQNEILIELQHSGYKRIDKRHFLDVAKPNVDLRLSSDEKRALKQWLAARYGRPAFPDQFESRLQKNKKFYEKLVKLLKPINQYLIGIFFDLNGDRENELAEGSPYYLKISLVYDATNGQLARETIELSRKKIIVLFHETFGTPDIAGEIALEDCSGIADSFFSFADARKTDQWWRYDYLSLAESPLSPFLPLGTMSF